MSLMHRNRKIIALFFLQVFLFQTVGLNIAYALTSGPTQPEVQSFQPAGTTEMVDLFTGDFGYNIPLLELPGPNGGYPFNLSYQSGIGMDQEASWVGLGFNLNPGAITRQMRGLPDEFNGDEVYTKMSIEPSVTVGLGAGVGAEIFGGSASLGIGFSVSQNNYTGFGYSIDGSLGFQQAVGSGMTGGIGLNVSLNPKEGIGVSPSLSLGGKLGEFGLTGGYHSKQGFTNISLSHSHNYGLTRNFKMVNRDAITSSASNGTTVSSSLSMSHPGYTPQISMPMKNLNLSATFKIGGAWWGIFGSAYVRGFYNEQRLKNDKKIVKTDAYGYLYYQNAGTDDMLDFNREKDGMVTKESPNLGIPSQTYDIYSVTGQGMQAMYRPVRNDLGVMHDPTTTSISLGFAAGVDVAPAISHVGVNLDFNHSKSESGLWEESNQVRNNAAFQDRNRGDLYEPWYFKVHGEPTADLTATADDLGGDDAVKVALSGSDNDPIASTSLENNNWSGTVPVSSATNRSRKPRGTMIQTITNQQLLNGSSEVIPHFQVHYQNESGSEVAFDRSSKPDHHMAGYSVVSNEGLRYNYALPAYNLKQEEATFTVRQQADQTSRVNVGNTGQSDPDYTHSGTQNYLKRVELPPYAHSFLLTSILGPDYVDITGDGVTEDDLGYWVKFTYQRVAGESSPYKWRDPYSQAHFQEGWKTDPRDDKGYFVYGEKELWYLKQAETKSHIAQFTIQARSDGKGVQYKLQDSNTSAKEVYSLNEIKLFTRAGGSNAPIKTVRFDYDYSLCQGIYNNTSGGKLTLKKLWFEYGNSVRGSFNPYEFSYHQNPNYDIYSYDRWGNYKPYPSGDLAHNRDFPYAYQDPAQKEDYDEWAASWSLSEIQLPSGATILIDYESDDYAYVQHKQAMQMTEMVDPYSASTSIGSGEVTVSDNTKIRFKLEEPIPGTLSSAEQIEIVTKYIDLSNPQIYFKALMNLRSPSEDFHEFISGYADVDFSNAMGLEKDATGEYAYGYFHLAQEEGYHPFSLRCWQHLRTNQPELSNSGRELEPTDNTDERINQIKSLGSLGAQIRQMFGGFYNYCEAKNWGREMVTGKSWVRLKSPDKIKYGGGLRVKQITMKDGWSQDEEGIYGQIYEYTKEEDGEVISSGVAAYEPMVGGDENPMRYAKKYVETIPLRSNNNLYFEYPINETHYPAPRVGYSQVKVTSLPAASLAGKEVLHTTLSDGTDLFPTGTGVSYGTSGQTMHEFYTARDFPVITDETDKQNKPYKLSVLIPFLGSIAISKLAATQGYSVVTNDMHGKLKKVSNYRQDAEGNIDPTPISSVTYNYSHNERIYQSEKIREVINAMVEAESGTVRLASDAERNNTNIAKYALGQETDFFMDMRRFKDDTWGGGARINVDVMMIPLLFIIIPIPIPTVWPNVSKSTTELRTAVTNKVIFKPGVLESIETFQDGAVTKTTHLKWDKLSGKPILSTVDNNFQDPIYSYNLPAYYKYQGMGAAYQNTGYTFTINTVLPVQFQTDLYSFSTSSQELFVGDEIIVYALDSDFKQPVGRIVYVGQEDGEDMFYSETALPGTEFECMVFRSGYRNHLTATTASIQALDDPTLSGTEKIYSKQITIPKISE